MLFSEIDELAEPDLLTKEFGQKAYKILRQVLLETQSGEVLELNFEGIHVMDSSFAGASVIRLLRELVAGEYGERYVVLTNISSSTEENIHLTIVGYGLKLGIQVVESESAYRLLGQIEPNLVETLDLINQKKILTARQLADRNPDLAINTASNRLKKLFDLRQVRREERIDSVGKQHIYHSLLATAV